MSSPELFSNGSSVSAAAAANTSTSSDRSALLRSQTRPAYYGSCQGVSSTTAAVVDSELIASLKMSSTTSNHEDDIVPDPIDQSASRPAKAQSQPPPQLQPKKATLLSLAAAARLGSSKTSTTGSSSSEAVKLEDIIRKGIDIAREFNASDYTGRPNVIKLEVSDSMRRQSMIEFDTAAVRIADGRGGGGGYQHQMSARSPGDVVIEMPPIHLMEDDQLDAGNSNGLDEAASRWRLRRQRNHSESSKAPLISDV